MLVAGALVISVVLSLFIQTGPVIRGQPRPRNRIGFIMVVFVLLLVVGSFFR